eukprot:Ihof_evm2s813 gene=Ihof_evmTU2s813
MGSDASSAPHFMGDTFRIPQSQLPASSLDTDIDPPIDNKEGLDDPMNFTVDAESVTSLDWPEWESACHSELKDLTDRAILELVEFPKGKEVLRPLSVFKKKFKTGSVVPKYKARLVVCGNQQRPDEFQNFLCLTMDKQDGIDFVAALCQQYHMTVRGTPSSYLGLEVSSHSDGSIVVYMGLFCRSMANKFVGGELPKNPILFPMPAVISWDRKVALPLADKAAYMA